MPYPVRLPKTKPIINPITKDLLESIKQPQTVFYGKQQFKIFGVPSETQTFEFIPLKLIMSYEESMIYNEITLTEAIA
jgi:hypothetical protein